MEERKSYQQKFYYSSEELQNITQEGLKYISDKTNLSRSAIMEEYIILGLIRDIPESDLRKKLVKSLEEKMEIRRKELDYFENELGINDDIIDDMPML